jgi:flagellar hook-associated protein 3 FlgL
MINTLDGASQLFLANVNRVQQRLAQANQELTSGKKINQPSDAPDQIDALLQLRADQQHNQQIQSNLTLAQSNAQAADQTLGSAIQLLDRALTLASQGANSATDAASLQSLAQQVQSVQQEMVSYSQTTVQGVYIFSGDQGQSQAYQWNSTTNTVQQVATVTASSQIEDPAGGSFPQAKTASEIFDLRNSDGTVASGNVFDALQQLYTALSTGTPANVANSIAGIKAASDHLNSMEAFYGDVETRIQDAQTFSNSYDTQLQTQISQKQDADVTTDAIELTQAQTQLQAAFQMQAAMPRKSLFDYLG